MSQFCETEIYRACRTLFGPDLQLNRSFLSYLQPSGVRSAYRRQAKEIHPDRFAVAAAEIRNKQHHLFQDLNQAHQTIQHFLKLRRHNKVTWQPAGAYRNRTPTRPQQSSSGGQRQSYRVPPYPLQFGMFLYYLGVIPFKDMIAAITWQRRQRPQMGVIAKRWGWLTDDNIRQIIAYRGNPLRFGEKAEKLGLLSSLQVRTLLFHQRSRQKQIGEYFIEQGFFDEATLHDLLSRLAEHNRRYRKDLSSQFYYYHS